MADAALRVRTTQEMRDAQWLAAAGEAAANAPNSPHQPNGIGSPKAGYAAPPVPTQRESELITHYTPAGAARAPPSAQVGAPAAKRKGTKSQGWGPLRFLCCFQSNEEADGEAEAADAYPQAQGRRAPQVHVPRFMGKPSMPPQQDMDRGKKTLVLDLDETLVHSTFTPVPNPDYIIPVEIDNKVQDVFVRKRPFVDHFMKVVGQKFEVVVFTASLAKYADPLLDQLDITRTIRHRLFRESCVPYEGNYVKDLSRLGRPLASTIIVDNSPHSYMFQPECAVPISTFVSEPEDRALLELLTQLDSLIDEPDIRDGVARIVASLPPNYGYAF